MANSEGNLNIAGEMCSLWLTRLNDIQSFGETLIQGHNNALQRCTQLEEENKLLRQQLEFIRQNELDELKKENEKLKQTVQELKQNEELTNRNFLMLGQTCETIYNKLSTVPLIKNSKDTAHSVINFSQNVLNATLTAPDTGIDNSEKTIIKNVGSDRSESINKYGNDVIQNKNLIPKNKSVQIEGASSVSSMQCKSSEEKDTERMSIPFNNLSEDMQRLDKYNAVAAKRKLANEISYSEAKKIKSVNESSGELVIDESGDKRPATPKDSQDVSMSIFTKRKLGSIKNKFEAPKEQLPECNYPPNKSKENDSSSGVSKLSDRNSTKVQDPRANKRNFEDVEHKDGRILNHRNDRNTRHRSRSRSRFDERRR